MFFFCPHSESVLGPMLPPSGKAAPLIWYLDMQTNTCEDFDVFFMNKTSFRHLLDGVFEVAFVEAKI